MVSRRSLRAGFERLEDRALLSATPFGALQDDTGEYMLGDVLVTVVLMESSENTNQYNANTENWTPASIQVVKDKVVEGVTWWEDTLAIQHPDAVHALDFHFDFTYADNPVSTDYEPISQISNYFQYWMYDFLKLTEHTSGGNFSNDIRAFNHAQRLAYGTDWAFTIFVVNDANDADGWFAPGGSFSRAFSFAGGQFLVSPAGRPASTFAHETGHMFWARDEYSGGGSYTDHRGYYDTYNWNAYDNPAPGFTQVDSLMATGYLLDNAYAANTSSPSSLEMIGWRDSDHDGIFDVLDVPLALTGSGYYDPDARAYKFIGSSAVQPSFNLNPSGQQNDITLNRIAGVEYRVDGGAWQATESYDDYVVDLNLELPLSGDEQTIEIRTVGDVPGITSNVFLGSTSELASVLEPGINGLVWADDDDDGQYDPGESGLEGWSVRLVDATGQPLDLVESLDPDDYALFSKLTDVHPEVTLTLPGQYAAGDVIATSNGAHRVFGNSFGTTWTPTGPEMRMDFAAPVTAVRLDAIGTTFGDYARLDAYDANDVLLARYTTDALNPGSVETMLVQHATPEIAYAVASGHLGTGVRLDHLRFGPETIATTNDLGTFSIPCLAAGTYFVEAVSPTGEPASGWQAVNLGEGEALGEIDFGIFQDVVSWRNDSLPADISGDGLVLPIDALLLINYLNENGNGSAVPSDPQTPPPYLDVDGDNFITASDVLIVVNALNSAAGGNGEGPTADGEGPAAGSGTPGAAVAEGEFAAMPWSTGAVVRHRGGHFSDRPFTSDILPDRQPAGYVDQSRAGERNTARYAAPRDAGAANAIGSARAVEQLAAHDEWMQLDVEDAVDRIADDVARSAPCPRGSSMGRS